MVWAFILNAAAVSKSINAVFFISVVIKLSFVVRPEAYRLLLDTEPPPRETEPLLLDPPEYPDDRLKLGVDDLL